MLRNTVKIVKNSSYLKVLENPEYYNPNKKELFGQDHLVFSFLVYNYMKDNRPKPEGSYEFFLDELLSLKGITKPDNFIRMSIGTNLRQSTNVTSFFQ